MSGWRRVRARRPTDDVTALRIYGTAIEFDLPRTKPLLTLGSGESCDIAIAGCFLSTVHCLLERRGGALRVRDQQSRNFTMFRGRREDVFDARPGDSFVCAKVRFLVLNDVMRAAYPRLVEIIGDAADENPVQATDKVTASDVVVAATQGAHLVLTGEPGSDHDHLARLIHGISLRRDRAVVDIGGDPPGEVTRQREIIDRASRSTAIITIGDDTPIMDETFRSWLFSPSYHVRVIVVAPSLERTQAVLGRPNLQQLQHVWVQPLRLRSGAIPAILDRMLAERETPLRFNDLLAKHQIALREYRWPGNLDELRVVADRLIVLVREGSLRKAAKVLEIKHTSLDWWMTRLGISMPLVAR